MTPDDVINLRHTWAPFTYSDKIPARTILASSDWTKYVTAMATALPPSDQILVPTQEEVRWAWPAGVVVVLEEPVSLWHTIISHEERGDLVFEEPHIEQQRTRAIAFLEYAEVPVPLRNPDGDPLRPMQMQMAQPLLYIGDDPQDIISGRLSWGSQVHAAEGMKVGGSLHFTVSLAVALGHRLTTLARPTAMPRAMRRRMERSLPDLRVIELTHPASRAESRGSQVEWARRWIVRGHWRQQPCGPASSLRRITWIDPFVKGPEDKPLDIRPTVWTAEP